MLDKIILGMLSLSDFTSYELKKAMDRSIQYFYTTSYGSLHPALVKLEKKGLATAREFQEGARRKKSYSITDKGLEVFGTWLREEISLSRMKEDAVVRIFFFGFLANGERKDLISGFIEEIDRMTEVFREMKQSFLATKIPPEHRDIADFQGETLAFGMDQAGFMASWFRSFYTRLEERETTK